MSARPSRTSVTLSKEAKILIDNNIENFSDWVNDKVIDTFSSKKSYEIRKAEIQLELQRIQDKLTEFEMEEYKRTKELKLEEERQFKVAQEKKEKTNLISEKLEELTAGLLKIPKDNFKQANILIENIKNSITETDLRREFSAKSIGVVKKVWGDD